METKGAPAEVPIEVRAGMLQVRFVARSNETAWREATRVFIVGLTFTVCWGLFGLGTALLVGPIIFAHLGFSWEHTNSRIGENAQYIELELEPRMEAIDGVPGFEKFLAKRRRARRTRALTRLFRRTFFPMFQLGSIAGGVYHYVVESAHTTLLTWLVIVACVIDLAIVAVTIAKVKHVRGG